MCENGCLSFFQGEMIYRETMSRSLGQEIMQAIWKGEGCEILLSGVHTSYLQPKKNELLLSYERCGEKQRDTGTGYFSGTGGIHEDFRL